MVPKLSKDRTECTIGKETLKVKEPIPYKSATERQTSVGRIEEFMYAGYRQTDTSSVWMRITDMGKESVSEWISVYNWKLQLDKGIFGKTKIEDNASTESEATEDLPF